MDNYFIIKNEKVKNACLDYIRALDGEWVIDIYKFEKNRSAQQNRLYSKWVDIIASETGHQRRYMRSFLACEILGVEEVFINGKMRHIPVSTADLNVNEMADFMKNVDAFAMALNINLPRPDDYKFIIGE